MHTVVAVVDAALVRNVLTTAISTISDCSIIFVPFEKLSQSMTLFVSADVVVIDMTKADEKCELFYLYGVREGLGFRTNVVLHQVDPTLPCDPQLAQMVVAVNSCIGYSINPTGSEVRANNEQTTLLRHMTTTLTRLVHTSRADNRADRVKHWITRSLTLDELNTVTNDILQTGQEEDASPNIVLAILLKFRDLREYSAMIAFYDACKLKWPRSCEPVTVVQLYVFALNRRNHDGDRKRALQVIRTYCQKFQSEDLSELYCAEGRIHKDLYVESMYTDSRSLDKAIKCYRSAFALRPTTYAAVNAATLLVASGEQFESSKDLHQFIPALWTALGRVQPLLKDLLASKEMTLSDDHYWTVATALEINVLSSHWKDAAELAEALLSHRLPELWMLASTWSNIAIIMNGLGDAKKTVPTEERVNNYPPNDFLFWMDFLSYASKDSINKSLTDFPVLDVFKSNLPSHLILDNERIVCQDLEHCPMWGFSGSAILKICADDRQLTIVVREMTEPFIIVFPNVAWLQVFKDKVEALRSRSIEQASPPGSFEVFEQEDEDESKMQNSLANAPFDYSFMLNPDGSRHLLGFGSFGSVFGAFNKDTGLHMAVKVVLMMRSSIGDRREEKLMSTIDEINLLRRFKHENIVAYYGAHLEGNNLLVFMEWVSGGSLSTLLTSWGPLNLSIVKNYTAQALTGLEYLHFCNIVHRDIKCANILVTHSGIIKIADFGASKRLKTLSMRAHSMHGTIPYMAPEVITDGNGQGYGCEADIWSMGCTVIEMVSAVSPWAEIKEKAPLIWKVGHGEHPPYPEEAVAADTTFHKFLNECFVIDPASRSTAKMLLQHPFLIRTPHPSTSRTASFIRMPSLNSRVERVVREVGVIGSTNEEEHDHAVPPASKWLKLKSTYLPAPEISAFADVALKVIEKTKGWLLVHLIRSKPRILELWNTAMMEAITDANVQRQFIDFFPLMHDIYVRYVELRSSDDLHAVSTTLADILSSAQLSIGVINKIIYAYRRIVMQLASKDGTADPSWAFAIDNMITSTVADSVSNLSEYVLSRRFAVRRQFSTTVHQTDSGRSTLDSSGAITELLQLRLRVKMLEDECELLKLKNAGLEKSFPTM